MRIRLFAALLLSLPALAPVHADTVYLANGRSFEGVIAEETASEVRIQMPGGSLSLPRSHVLRVEKSESDFAEYLKRKTALQRGGHAGGADWLALARWARSQGLEQGAREAALAAADLDPKLEGLAPLLRGYGYVLDAQLDRWIPYADSMRRRGFVQANGQWITREEHAARQRAEQEESARRTAERASMRAAQATQAAREAELALVEMELRDRLSRSSTGGVEGVAYYGLPLYAYPWYVPTVPNVPPPCRHCGPGQHPEPHKPPHHQPPAHNDSTFTHVPGSLIPGRPMTSSSSSQR
jgi:hypothetical protein